MHEPNLSRTSINAGTLPYFDFPFLYDAERGVLGLERREPAVPQASAACFELRRLVQRSGHYMESMKDCLNRKPQ